ncbi:hypothetical protein ASE_0018 [Yersinia phage Yepe2]|uniref:Gp4.2 n=2 Tax=Berlinvirus TaxID=2732677 RepID=A0ZXJ4_9CAUD|nr:hypothetical protein ASE_0018 [Yersinia phage Yepe2]YP_918998.1 hypothetical protein YPBV_gp15 [Yersinia phage Berlin]ACF15699.1 gp4.2 [Yersinia phage Yepe2]CAJ70666.1 hypothetical protein [Yersinia phage Berlin]
MKKVVQLALLTYVAAVLCANYLILSLLSNATSKGIIQTLFNLGCLSVALLVILVWLGIWPTTRKPDGLNRLSHLKMKEAEIAAGNQKKTVRTSDSKPIQLTNGADNLFPLINPLKEKHNV